MTNNNNDEPTTQFGRVNPERPYQGGYSSGGAGGAGGVSGGVSGGEQTQFIPRETQYGSETRYDTGAPAARQSRQVFPGDPGYQAPYQQQQNYDYEEPPRSYDPPGHKRKGSAAVPILAGLLALALIAAACLAFMYMSTANQPAPAPVTQTLTTTAVSTATQTTTVSREPLIDRLPTQIPTAIPTVIPTALPDGVTDSLNQGAQDVESFLNDLFGGTGAGAGAGAGTGTGTGAGAGATY